MKNSKYLIIFLILSILFINSMAYGEEEKKTVIVILDELNIELADEISDGNFSIGLMNTRTRRPYSEESYFMTIATGRKVKITERKFQGLQKRDDGSLKVIGFESIMMDLNKNYTDFTEKIDFFGEKSNKEGVSYIGKDSSSLMACDKDGVIKKGETNIHYDNSWLNFKTKYFLKDSNILILSYEINGDNSKLKLLKDYIEDIDDCDVIIFPKKVSKDMKKVVNNSLVPIMYKSSYGNAGVLTTDATKRKGIVTNLDILPQVMSMYDIKNEVSIGKKFNIFPSDNPIDEINTIYKEVINMTWITYIFHGIVYFIQAYFTYFFVKNRRDKYWDITFYFNFIIISIFISFLMGIFNMGKNLLLYIIICIMLSYSISHIITNKKINGAAIFSTLTYIIMLIGIFFNQEFIYKSYIGYDNLIVGSRYYGFNNGAMAILLSSSIVSYFTIKKYLSNEILEKIFLLLYFILNIVALSAKFGANTGGFFTSIVLFLAMVYTVFFDKKLTFKNVVILILLGGLILFINLFVDLNSFDKGHAGSLIYRAKILGKKEVYDIVRVKLKQLLIYTISPPWCIVLISQIIFIKSFWDKVKLRLPYILEKRPEIQKEYMAILITAITAFIVNDTGVIAFIYMIQYLLVLFVNISIAEEV